MERKLASVQKIIDIQPIEGADNIELVKVLGWQSVAKKGIFNKDDLAVYFEIDSFLPVIEKYEFLRKSSFKDHQELGKGFRLKTVRLKGALSQGLVLPMSDFTLEEIPEDKRVVGEDVTELLNIKKYEYIAPMPNGVKIAGNIKGTFPPFLRKTDETRVQAIPEVLQELKGKPYYITTKMDGTSSTYFFHNGEFGVCSRNFELKEEEGNLYWNIAKKYDLENKFKSLGTSVCIQGEICGPGLQKNPLKLEEHELYVFNAYNINTHRFLSWDELTMTCSLFGLKTVPLEELHDSFSYDTIESILSRASGNYSSGIRKEGIVIRSQEDIYSKACEGRLSFKAINNEYLLKNED